MRRPTGILPGGNVFQVPPPAVEASESSTVGAGEAGGAAVMGEAAATTRGVDAGEAAGDFRGGGQGATGGRFCATTGGPGELAGAGVGEGFLFFANFPPFGVAVGRGVGIGDAAATSICCAGSTRIKAFSAAGGGVGARPATTVVGRLGATRSR